MLSILEHHQPFQSTPHIELPGSYRNPSRAVRPGAGALRNLYHLMLSPCRSYTSFHSPLLPSQLRSQSIHSANPQTCSQRVAGHRVRSLSRHPVAISLIVIAIAVNPHTVAAGPGIVHGMSIGIHRALMQPFPSASACQKMLISSSGAEYKELHVCGIKFRVADVGSGPAVLLLHGFPCDSSLWKHQVRRAAQLPFCGSASTPASSSRSAARW